MKNMKKLAVISLVVMMMVTAVGYAAFSDDLTVKGTASNAKFDVQFTEATDGEYIDLLVNTAAKGPGHGNGPKDPKEPKEPKDNPDVISVKVTNLIPGQQATATGKIKNFGTVYAYLDAQGPIVKETQHYVMTLELPAVLGYENDEARVGDFTLTVLMKDHHVSNGIDAGDIEDSADIEFSYRQQ